MKILLARKMGFCFGVKKSIDLANKTIAKENQTVYMLGPIIHNPQVVKSYQERGVKLVDNLDSIPDGSIVITRAHGISPEISQQAEDKKIIVIDTTCSNVKKLQKIALYLKSNKYYLVIFGDKKHPEITSILEMVNHDAMVINGPREFTEIKESKKIGFISQTTKNIYDFKKLALLLLEKTKELRILNTICPEIGRAHV